MKITLPDQIAEARIHRNALAKAVGANPALQPRLDRPEAILLTLAMYEAVEPEFREFMNTQSKGSA